MNPDKVTYFAETDSRNKRVAFGIRGKDRTRHIYCIGKTGMGKSTLLENMAVQDIQSGEGMAFIDPHGKTAELLLEYVPQERIKDVIYFAPFDTEHPISFNVMEDVGADKRHLVVNGLMSAFKKIWVDAWSARMEYILSNTLLALLEYPNSTLLGVNRMLADKDYRNRVVANISDPSVKSFWVDEFAKYGERYMQEAGAAIQNKIGQFTANPLVRNIIGQPKSTFDMRKVMDDQKIVIINLSKGRVGEQNANLLGSMLITRIYLSAMSRADVTESALKSLPNFYLYVDEFQSFANESFADILSEARKYKLNLTIAHQYIEQMSEEVRAAVFGNVGTMITFRVGAYDAEVLEKEFAPVFTAEDLVNLGSFQIYLKLMINGVSSQPFSAVTQPPIPKPEISYRDDIMESSRSTFARPKAEIEAEIRAWHEEGTKRGDDKITHKQQDRPFQDSGSVPVEKPAERVEKKPEGKVSETNNQRTHQASSHKPESKPAEFRDSKPQAPERSPAKDIQREKREMFEAIMAEEKQNELERITPKPISLGNLNRDLKKNEKAPQPQHVSDLKRALESLLPSQKQTVPPKVNTELPKKPEPFVPKVSVKQEETKRESATTEERKETESSKKKGMHEIPEAELRDLLKVDMEE